MNVRASVKVINPKHNRTGQAGVVQSTDDEEGTAVVKFDLAEKPETVKVADLQELGQN